MRATDLQRRIEPLAKKLAADLTAIINAHVGERLAGVRAAAIGFALQELDAMFAVDDDKPEPKAPEPEVTDRDIRSVTREDAGGVPPHDRARPDRFAAIESSAKARMSDSERAAAMMVDRERSGRGGTPSPVGTDVEPQGALTGALPIPRSTFTF